MKKRFRAVFNKEKIAKRKRQEKKDNATRRTRTVKGKDGVITKYVYIDVETERRQLGYSSDYHPPGCRCGSSITRC